MLKYIDAPKKQAPVIARLSLAALDDLILAIRRLAARRHLTPAEWRALDRMRRRAERLRKERIEQ